MKIEFLTKKCYFSNISKIILFNFYFSALIALDIRLGGLELQSAAERLSREIVHNNKILFKYSGLLKLSFPFYKVRLIFQK